MNYKDTLLMPKTEFPMRGNLPQREPAKQTEWNEEQIYQKVLERTKDRPMFVLHDGPPYANGDIHIGHALNKILKDFIVRFKSMSGFYAPYIPGWDTHGLPIEQALTNSGVNRKEMTVAEFRQLCENYAYKQIDNQREQFKRLGVRADWENPYITLKPEYEAAQIQVFGEMAKKGFIYKGLKPVYWSPSSESALAEAEIEYQDKKSASIYVAFDVKKGNSVLDEGTKIIIWTTTPWTIPANLGISVHPELNYAVVEANESRFVVAEALLEEVAGKIGWESYTTEKIVKGQDLEYVVAAHPLYGRDSLVMLGEHVTTDSGTGAVHTAPGHGEDDFVIGKKYGLDVLCPVNDRGVMTNEAPGFEGMFYDKANKAITEKLAEAGALLKMNFITHSYPHDWRTKKPVIYRATAQWFASIDKFRPELLKAVEATKWVPAWGETRLYNMIRDRGDWCISRQRAWGVPIPVFYAENGEAIITDETIAHVSKMFREHGSNVWFKRETKELLPEGFTHPGSPNGEFTKENDIMDVWFDSGSSHAAVLHQLEDAQRPADLYLEGSDQYRGWFNSSLITSVAVTGQAPYKGVVSHGFALDGEGRKMSKSLGNTVVPAKVMEQLGADILRLWVASVDYQADVRVSDAILKQVAEVYRKIRNTFRFLLGNLDGFDPSKHAVSFENLREVDQFMLVQLNQLIKTVRNHYENYEFAAIYHAINNFCTVNLSSFYLDFTKDVLYIEAQNNAERRAIQTVLYETLTALAKLVSPILPHTADEVWAEVPGAEEKYVQLTDMPDYKELAGAEKLTEKWTAFMAVRDDVLKALEAARNEKVIGKSLTAHIRLFADSKTADLLNSIEEDLKQLFIVSGFERVRALQAHPFLGQPVNVVVTATDPAATRPRVDLPVTLVCTWGRLRSRGEVRPREGNALTLRTDGNGMAHALLLPPTSEGLLPVQQSTLEDALRLLDPAAVVPRDTEAGLREMARRYRWHGNVHLRGAIDIYYRDFGKGLLETVNALDHLAAWSDLESTVLVFAREGSDETPASTSVEAAAALSLRVRNWVGPWLEALQEVTRAESRIADDLAAATLEAEAGVAIGRIYTRLRDFVTEQRGLVGEYVGQRVAESSVRDFMQSGMGQVPTETQRALLPSLDVASRALTRAGGTVLAAVGQTRTELHREIDTRVGTEVGGMLDQFGARLDGVEAGMEQKLDTSVFNGFQAQIGDQLGTLVDQASFDAFQQQVTQDLGAKVDQATFSQFQQQVNTRLDLTVSADSFQTFQTEVDTRLGSTADATVVDSLSGQLNDIASQVDSLRTNSTQLTQRLTSFDSSIRRLDGEVARLGGQG